MLVVKLMACVIPCLVIIWIVSQYGVEVPLGDDWSHVRFIDNFLNDRLDYVELLDQHNEHRPATLRLMRILSVWAGGWSVKNEMYFSLVLTGLNFLLFAYIIRYSHRRLEVPFPVTLLLAVSLLNWSLRQWENFLWGHQINFFLQNVFVLVSLALLTVGKRKVHKVLFSCLFAALSSYSSGAGLLVWPVGLMAMLIDYYKDVKTTRSDSPYLALIVIWCSFAFMVYGHYFHGYIKPSGHPDLTYSIHHPFDMLMYLAAYLGSPFVGRDDLNLAIVLGGAGLGLWLYIVFSKVKSCDGYHFWRYLPWISVGLFAILSGILIGISRVGFGIEQSLCLRYVTNSILFWISLVVMCSVAYGEKAGRVSNNQISPGLKKVGLAIVTLLMMMTIGAAYTEMSHLQKRAADITQAREALLKSDFTNKDLDQLYPDRSYLLATDAILRKWSLSLYHDLKTH